MQDNNKVDQNSKDEQVGIVFGSADGAQMHSQIPVPIAAAASVRHRFAEIYVLVSFISMLLVGVVMPLVMIYVFVFLGAIPVGVLGIINLCVVPILLIRRLLSGWYKVLSIVVMVFSILAIVASIFFVVSVSSVVNNSNQKSNQMNAYYRKQESIARSEATVEQATKLLNSCQVIGFYYTQQDGTKGSENAEKTGTGILLYKLAKSFEGLTTPSSVDGGKYRMHIADRMIDTMVPIARNAQLTCGIQFWHEGEHEQYKDGRWTFKGEAVQIVEAGNPKEEAISFIKNCKADYFVGYTDLNLIKDSATKSWLNKAEFSSTGIVISEGSPYSYVYVSKSMTTVLQDTARQARKTCYYTKKLYITIDNFIETEYPIGTWVKKPI